MPFISMYLIGDLHPKSSAGNCYALTVICMLTRYMFCISIKFMSTSDGIQAYIYNVYAKFVGFHYIL